MRFDNERQLKLGLPNECMDNWMWKVLELGTSAWVLSWWREFFRSTPKGVLTAHTGVWLRHFSHNLCSSYRGLWKLVVVRLSLLSGRTLAAQTRGVLGLMLGDCWPFYLPLFWPQNSLIPTWDKILINEQVTLIFAAWRLCNLTVALKIHVYVSLVPKPPPFLSLAPVTCTQCGHVATSLLGPCYFLLTQTHCFLPLIHIHQMHVTIKYTKVF